MNETYRTDAIRDLAAAQRELAAEVRQERQELTSLRSEIHTASSNVTGALAGAGQWCGIGLIIGIFLGFLIFKKAPTT